MALEAYGKGLIGTTLHYPYEVRDAKNYFADIADLTPAPELLALAALIVRTVLVRDYQGRRHTVTVAPDGYDWEGEPYSSLTAIARAITGTAWSGPRFFALKSSTPTERPEAAHRPASSPATIIPGASTASPRDPTGALAAPEPH